MRHEGPIKGTWGAYERALGLGCPHRKEKEPLWPGKNPSLLHVCLQKASGELPRDKQMLQGAENVSSSARRRPPLAFTLVS